MILTFCNSLRQNHHHPHHTINSKLGKMEERTNKQLKIALGVEKDNEKIESQKQNIEIELERAQQLMHQARRYIFREKEIENMTPAEIREYLSIGMKKTNLIKSNLWDSKWKLQAEKCPIEELSKIISEIQNLEETEQIFKAQAKARNISSSNKEVKLMELYPPPNFEGREDENLYQWHENFHNWCKLGNYDFDQPGLWIYCLHGAARESIYNIHGNFSLPSTMEIWKTLKDYYGDIVKLLDITIQKVESLGPLKGIMSEDWSEIEEKSFKLLSLIRGLKSLEAVDGNLINKNWKLEKTLSNAVLSDSHFYWLYNQKKENAPNSLLENIESIIRLKLNQVQEKANYIKDSGIWSSDVKVQEENGFSPLDTKNQVTIKGVKYSAIRLHENPVLSCHICQAMKVNSKEAHIIGFGKNKPFIYTEMCPSFLNLNSVEERHKIMSKSNLCLICLKEKNNNHSSNRCLFTKKMKFLKCKRCWLRFSVCKKHTRHNEKKFKKMQNEAKRFNLCIKNNH